MVCLRYYHGPNGLISPNKPGILIWRYRQLPKGGLILWKRKWSSPATTRHSILQRRNPSTLSLCYYRLIVTTQQLTLNERSISESFRPPWEIEIASNTRIDYLQPRLAITSFEWCLLSRPFVTRTARLRHEWVTSRKLWEIRLRLNWPARLTFFFTYTCVTLCQLQTQCQVLILLSHK